MQTNNDGEMRELRQQLHRLIIENRDENHDIPLRDQLGMADEIMEMFSVQRLKWEQAAITHVMESLARRKVKSDDYVSGTPVIHVALLQEVLDALQNPDSLLMRELATLSKEETRG